MKSRKPAFQWIGVEGFKEMKHILEEENTMKLDSSKLIIPTNSKHNKSILKNNSLHKLEENNSISAKSQLQLSLNAKQILS